MESPQPQVSTACIQTNHEDMIHDAELDFYGTKLATCSSDGKIKIFDVNGENSAQIAELAVHSGPVWQVVWSHPKNGIYLASCSYDGSVVIHKEVSRGRFDAVYTFHENNLSINCLAWGPHELGLVLCCGSADGVIYLLSFRPDSTWEKKSIKCCNMGINSISWAPFHHLGYQDKSNHTIYRFVCGSSDNVIRIYSHCSNSNAVGGSNAFGVENEWKKEFELSGHKDSVRSVSWSPSAGLPSNTIASGGNDKQVMIWSQNELNGDWSHKNIATMNGIVWNVNWNHSGQCLAVASGDEDVCLFKQNIEDKEWEKEQIN